MFGLTALSTQSKIDIDYIDIYIPWSIAGVSQCDVANAQIVIGSQDSHGIAQGMTTFKP